MRLILALLAALVVSSHAHATTTYVFDQQPANWNTTDLATMSVTSNDDGSMTLTETLPNNYSFLGYIRNHNDYVLDFDLDTAATVSSIAGNFTVITTPTSNGVYDYRVYRTTATLDHSPVSLTLTADHALTTDDFVANGQAVFRSDVVNTLSMSHLVSGQIAAPEPASLSLLGVGVMGMLVRKRRRV